MKVWVVIVLLAAGIGVGLATRSSDTPTPRFAKPHKTQDGDLVYCSRCNRLFDDLQVLKQDGNREFCIAVCSVCNTEHRWWSNETLEPRKVPSDQSPHEIGAATPNQSSEDIATVFNGTWHYQHPISGAMLAIVFNEGKTVLADNQIGTMRQLPNGDISVISSPGEPPVTWRWQKVSEDAIHIDEIDSSGAKRSMNFIKSR